MLMNLTNRLKILCLSILFCAMPVIAPAQRLLNRDISIDVRQRPLEEMLDLIGTQGGFYFSYNSSILNGDSLVSLSAQRISVRQALERLLDHNYQYKEVDNYIIIQRNTEGQPYVVSGYVVDRETGERVSNASVYEAQQLASTLTNDQGFFRLRLKDKYPLASISVSKLSYVDTFMLIGAGRDQELTVSLMPKSFELSSVTVTPNSGVEKTWFGNFFLSSRQRMQSLNLNKFFVDKPVQVSVTPGLGTHGKMSGQVVNKFSLNMIGGYTAGVNGVEIGSIFNIVKKDVSGVQIAGCFNVTGEEVIGVQLAGLHNHVLDSVTGVQAAGFSNWVRGSLEGVQATGTFSHVAGSVKGVQVSGAVSYTGKKMEGTQVGGTMAYTRQNLEGVQVAGIASITGDKMHGVQASGLFSYARNADGVQVSGFANIVSRDVEGVQAASFFNYAGHLKGVQVGVINICDTSSGYSIGIFNFVRKGIHRLTISTDETVPLNLAYRSGNKKLYSIFQLGANPVGNQKLYYCGYGLGREFPLAGRFSLTAELMAGALNLGSLKNTSSINRLNIDFNVRLHDKVAMFAGPSFCVFHSQDPGKVEGYRSDFSSVGIAPFNIGGDARGWIGWHMGLNIF